MDGLIKSVRLDVIDDLVKEFANNGGNSYFIVDGQEYRTDTGYAMEGIELFVEKLKERASKEIEQPERKRGMWNKYYRMHFGDTFCCNKCGVCFIVLQGSESMNFCPNCGADMRDKEGGQ